MTLLPGATVGVLGGGQLARMMGFEAQRMGYRVAVLDPDPQCGARVVADDFVEARWDDPEGAMELAELADVVTLDTEHIPWQGLAEVEKVTALRPGAQVLRTVQDRLEQKRFLETHGFPTAPFHPVATDDELRRAVGAVGAPAVFKTRRGGYDGKGQSRVREAGGAGEAWAAIDRKPAILEAFVPFEREVSVVLARSVDGDVAYYPVVENVHHQGILHLSRAPARVGDAVAARAREVAAGIVDAFDYCGVMAVEMFVLPEDAAGDQGRVLVNEIAPRVHNSGHLTQAAATSQFAQHVRAVCGHPLGDATLPRPTVMVNLLGDLWNRGDPAWARVLGEPQAQLHLYGKSPPRPGRKMGHVNVAHEDLEEAARVASRLHKDLSDRAGLQERRRREAPPT